MIAEAVMPMPFSSAPPTLCPSDLASQVHVAHVAMHRLMEAVCKLSFEDATSADLDPINGERALRALHRNFEGTIEDLRTMFTEALKTPGAINGSVASLVVALDARRKENDIAAECRPRGPLSVAMRNVDAIEAAERGLIGEAHDRGDRISWLGLDASFHSPMAG